MIYAYNGILLSLKKEENPAIWHKDEPERHDTKQNKSDTKRNAIFQRQSGKVVTRERERKLGRHYVTGYTEFQVRKIKVLERMVVTVAQQNECT